MDEAETPDPVKEEAEVPSPAPRAGPAPGSGPDVSFLVATGIAIVAAVVLVRNLLPAKEDLSRTLRREQVLQEEVESLRKERDLLEKQEEALRKDPVYMERVLRGQTGMSKPGEWIVR